MFKKAFIVVAIILTLWLATSYKGVDPNQTLVIGAPFEYTSQDLSKDGYIFSRFQVTETLVEIQPDGSIQPKLATHWQTSDDRLTWRFTLRPDVLFHDGTVMTAEAVVFSLQQALEKPGIIHQVPLNKLYPEGDVEVVLELEQPYRPLLSVLSHFSTAIASPSSFEQKSGRAIAILKGTGPYQIQLLSPPHKLDVERFDNYWGEPARIRQIQYLTGHRAESRALQARSGQADIIYTLDPASISMLEQAPNVDVYSESIPRALLLKMNNEHPYLNTVETRRALSLALDREGIAERIIRVPGSEAYQLFPPALGDWHLKELEGQKNLQKAREILTAQGWIPGADGVRVRDGKRFSLGLVTYADRPEMTVVATAIQAQFWDLGIEVTIYVGNSSDIPYLHHQGTLELALVARNFAWANDPLALLLDDTRTHLGSDWGHMNWSSGELNQLLSEMTLTLDSEAYFKLSQQAASILAEEMPVIPVTFYTQQIAVNKRLNNFFYDPFEQNYRTSEMYFD
ncbi:ABC transporter substrate-binding protein [Endozoicomonas lisbonensis]|uniref:Peptide/nickel transport system substrate-binding protein n=1 Tax=Endozoicomonas lisbonensis TaxID=3120522 RepID=A0ABV2SCZ8_9GAMM